MRHPKPPQKAQSSADGAPQRKQAKVSMDEALRRKVDQEDLKEAQRMMAATVRATVQSPSMTSTSWRSRQPPTLPPAPLNMDASSSLRRPLCSRKTAKLVSATLVLVASVGMGAFVITKELQEKKGKGGGALTSSTVKRESNQIRGGEQLRRVQNTKFVGTTHPALYQNNLWTVGTDINATPNLLPIQWKIPGTGDDCINEAVGLCMELTQALDEPRSVSSRNSNDELKFDEIETESGRFVKLDLRNADGVDAMQSADVLRRENLSLLSTEWLHDALVNLPRSQTKGQLFAMLRHPVERLLAVYYTLQDPSHPNFDSRLASMSLHEYADFVDDRPEFNFMVKSLVSADGGLSDSKELTMFDLSIAKTILKEHVVILILDDKLGSWAKLLTVMGWHESEAQKHCVNEVLMQVWPKMDHPRLEPDSALYQRLLKRVKWDAELYEYALGLFQEQADELMHGEAAESSSS